MNIYALAFGSLHEMIRGGCRHAPNVMTSDADNRGQNWNFPGMRNALAFSIFWLSVGCDSSDLDAHVVNRALVLPGIIDVPPPCRRGIAIN